MVKVVKRASEVKTTIRLMLSNLTLNVRYREYFERALLNQGVVIFRYQPTDNRSYTLGLVNGPKNF